MNAMQSYTVALTSAIYYISQSDIIEDKKLAPMLNRLNAAEQSLLTFPSAEYREQCTTIIHTNHIVICSLLGAKTFCGASVFGSMHRCFTNPEATIGQAMQVQAEIDVCMGHDSVVASLCGTLYKEVLDNWQFLYVNRFIKQHVKMAI